MSDIIGDGDRVLFPPKHVCRAHNIVKTEGQISQVDRFNARFGDYRIIVVFNILRHPPFNDPWVEGLSPAELQPA